jgi:enterochelin esterase-like enzyme
MKRSILFFALLLASASGLSAQRTASASMQIRATVVESSRLNVAATQNGAEVTSSSLSDVMISISQESNSGNTVMTPANVTLSSNETILAFGKTNPTQVKKIQVETANLSAAPQTYIVSAYYQ